MSVQKYSSGRRGAPAKGIGRVTGARVQIPPSAFCILKIIFKKIKKVVDKDTDTWYYIRVAAEQENKATTTKNLDNWTVKNLERF